MDNIAFGDFVIYKPDKDGDIEVEYEETNRKVYHQCQHNGYINIEQLKETIDRWYSSYKG